MNWIATVENEKAQVQVQTIQTVQTQEVPQATTNTTYIVVIRDYHQEKFSPKVIPALLEGLQEIEEAKRKGEPLQSLGDFIDELENSAD